MRRLFRDRNFRLLAAGQTLSAFGDYAMFLVIGIWAKDLTGSNAAAGITILPFVVPSLFGPALGVIVDRFPRRIVMVVTDLVAAIAISTLVFVHGRDDLWMLYVVSFAYGTTVTIYQAARSGLLVSMLAEEALGDANGFLQSSNQGMRLVAPLVGAGLFALAGGQAVALLDAGTFVISALLLLAVRSRDIDRRTDRVRLVEEVHEGLRHIWRTPDLRRLTIGTCFVTLLIGMSEVVIFALIDQGMHRPPEFLGVIASVQGAASIGAGLAAGWMLRRIGEMATIALAAAAAGLGLALFGTAVLPLVFAGGIGFGVANTLYVVAYTTVMQRRTDLGMQGRVMAAVEAVVTVPFLFSIAIGALIVTVVPFRVIYGVEAVGLLLTAVYFGRGGRDRETAAAVRDDAAA